MTVRTLALLSLLVLSSLAPAQGVGAHESPPPTVLRPPPLPRAVASFGAARQGGWLYVYGGHTGRAQRHSRRNVTGAFQRLDLAGGQSWQALPDSPPLQGTALVAAPDGSLYRIGGMTARNEPGEAEDLHSTASVQRFDVPAGRWEDATPLPEPRSSHDAVVLDGVLYVAGGWQLAGAGEPTWHDTAWCADLAERPIRWKALPPPPLRRRACALAACGHRLLVVGGIDDREPSPKVSVYDPRARSWAPGPDLPSHGFGAAALGVGDAVYASGMDGRLVRLDAGARAWVVCGQLAPPRFFHRFVLANDGAHLIAVGGATRRGHVRAVEPVALDESAQPSR